MMNEGIQTTLKEPIKSSGCLFLSLVKFVSLTEEVKYNKEKIELLFDVCCKCGYINPTNAFINDSEAVLNLIGRKSYKIIAGLDSPPDELAILQLQRDTDKSSHFMLVAPMYKWDPLPPNRQSAANWYPKSWRRVLWN